MNLRATVLSLAAFLLLPLTTLADEVAYVWSWPLSADASHPLWRVSLGPEVMAALNQADVSDLAVVDGRGQAVPFTRLSDQALIEHLRESRSLQHSYSLHDTAERSSPRLELSLDHDGTSLVLRAPSRQVDPEVQGQLLFEALVAGPESPSELPGHTLVLEFESSVALNMDCRLQDADESGPARTRIQLGQPSDSRPLRYRSRTRVQTLPRAWHVLCYGQQARPGDLKLVDAQLDSHGQRNHRGQAWVDLNDHQLALENGHFEFELPGPMRARNIRLSSPQPNLLSDLIVESRASPEQDWRERSRAVFSTLAARQTVEAELNQTERRDRYWRIRSRPPLQPPPGIEIEVDVEQLVFLAQGAPPWLLLGGSRSSGPMQAEARILESGRDQVGEVWHWPIIEPGERTEADGPAALAEPEAPLPWSRIGLWLILFSAAGLIVWLASRLLAGSD
jgi:hypothetical protein